MKVTRKSAKEFLLSATEEECRTIKSALNQVLELSDSDYSTLIGGRKQRSLAMLNALSAELKPATARPRSKKKAGAP